MKAPLWSAVPGVLISVSGRQVAWLSPGNDSLVLRLRGPLDHKAEIRVIPPLSRAEILSCKISTVIWL